MRYSRGSAYGNAIESIMAGEPVTGDALLTTDHAASSYGIPVLVIDGVAYGPAEAPAGYLHAHGWPARNFVDPLTPTDEQRLAEAARAAGYRLVGI